MTIILFTFALVQLALLVVLAAIVPNRSRFSSFELQRRQSSSKDVDELDSRREDTFVDIVSLQRILLAALIVGFVACAIGTWGWLGGIFVSILVSLGYGRLAGIVAVHRLAQQLYEKYERSILLFIERYAHYFTWVRTVAPVARSSSLASREELRNIVATSPEILPKDESSLILASLDFNQKLVRDIMTPKSVVDTIKRTEMLGPLVLNDLHKTGHSRFPVVDEDIDHIVGILYLRDVLTLDTSKKHTPKVETAMTKRVHYIREDHTLKQALTGFLKTHHHMFIVINQFRETVGIITLEDTVESLIGRRIVDEFDAHDDMRAVAERNAVSPSAPNHTKQSTDI